jgi:predicted TIM-barrel fold metal-dependent hydrolase
MWHPVWARLAEKGLVFGLHFGGTGDGPPTATGYPNHYFTDYVAEPTLVWAQITSMIAEGVFQAVPTLRVAVLEAGFTWVPSLAWRLSKEWKGLRRDIPWVDMAPTDTIRERFRFSTAPLDCVDAADVESFGRWLGSEELLMFATDYPHWHDDDVRLLVEGAPESARERIMAGNAMEWYRLADAVT